MGENFGEISFRINIWVCFVYFRERSGERSGMGSRVDEDLVSEDVEIVKGLR